MNTYGGDYFEKIDRQERLISALERQNELLGTVIKLLEGRKNDYSGEPNRPTKAPG